MELGTASILVQLLLIFVLVAVFAGRRHLRARREPRSQQPGSAALPSSPAPSVQVSRASAPQLVDLPPLAQRTAGTPEAQSLVPEELLPPCFADTCADWAQVNPVSGQAANTRFSLSDWSAPTNRMALDPTPARSVASAMSCTIAPQVRHCA